MKTVNSLSGGKTSSYLAVHYPADYEIFALVCIDAHNAGRRIDKSVRQQVNDRLQKYSARWPEFVATSEDPKVLTAMLDLEQMLGREIIWLRGMGWEEMIKARQAIPNKQKRFCTSVLKMEPIFEFLYLRTELPVKMRIGFRFDEAERSFRSDDEFKFPHRCEYRPKSHTWIQRWKTVQWRVPEYPLIEDRVTHYHVKRFWDSHSIDWPEDSNCQNCFWKPEAQLRKNFDTNPEIMQWAKIMEDIHGHTFRDEFNMHQINRLGIQQEFAFGVGAGCQAGFCTS